MQPRKYLYRGKTLAVEAHSTVNGTGYATYFRDRKGTRLTVPFRVTIIR